MNISTKLLQAAAGSAGGAGLDIDEVFSTFLYDGTGSAQTITNGIDLSGEGGLVITKRRDSSTGNGPYWNDTERGITSYVRSDSGGAQSTSTGSISSVTSSGYVLGTFNGWNNSSGEYVSWTFRKAPRFFDIQSWTGNSASDRAISHNLDSVPGMIIVKRLNSSEDWGVWHRDVHANTTKVLYLNKTDALTTSSSIFGATNPTSTNFYVGNHPVSNNNGDTYVAYIFAHNNGDGEFGPDSDQDIIKCGSFTTDGSGNATVNLGFEPQWLMVKATSNAYGWEIYDQMRGFGVTGHAYLFAHLANAEGSNSTAGTTQPTSTGFSIGNNYWGAGVSLIYMAIRRGPLAEPSSATDVFSINKTGTGDSPTNVWNVGFNADMNINTTTNIAAARYNLARLIGIDYLETNGVVTASTATGAKVFTSKSNTVDLKTSFLGNTSNVISWSWKRAPSYFDVVAYTGAGATQTINHNLGVKPEAILIKQRSGTTGWIWWYDAFGDNQTFIRGDLGNATFTNTTYFNNTAPTDTQITLGFHGNVNGSTSTNYIAYLFATVAGVSKVGSYTGTGAQQNIDCGFSSGARFVLIKRSSGTGHWRLMDSERGIVSGADKTLLLSSTNAEITDEDTVDPHSSGFSVPNNADVNASGSTYIFYAIA